MNAPRLCDLRDALGVRIFEDTIDGVIPAALCTCGADGMPNTAYVSQVFYVDEQHVAVSFQFFNKTRKNILDNPQAAVLLIDPTTAQQWRLHLCYLRTEDSGAVFESMKAQLAGIASHTGMDNVFKLRGADIYRVERIDQVPGEPLPCALARSGRLAVLRLCSEALARCITLEDALDVALRTVTGALEMEHAMLLLNDPVGQRLYTIASHGYPTSGVGSEVRFGQGVIGVCARERTAVRIGHMANAALYSQAMRISLEGSGAAPPQEIPYPGLAQPHSQLAAPLVSAGSLRGVLFVESAQERRFTHEDEDLLVAIAGHLAAAMEALRAQPEMADSAPPSPAMPRPTDTHVLQVKRFRSNDSVFVNDNYLIKGVAGAILWKLLRDHQGSGRSEFSNRELRLDASIGLPDLHDNLEARLILLQRRLAEQACGLLIEKTGRGRFRLAVAHAVQLQEAD